MNFLTALTILCPAILLGITSTPSRATGKILVQDSDGTVSVVGHCARHMQLKYSSNNIDNLYDLNLLEKAFKHAIPILEKMCSTDRDPLYSVSYYPAYKGHDLGLNLEADSQGNWLLRLTSDDRGTPSMLKEAPAFKFESSIPTHKGFSNTNRGGTVDGSKWRYSIMPKFLSGKSYAYYPYLPEDLGGVERGSTVARDQRVATHTISLGENIVTITKGGEIETVPYIERTKDAPAVACFKSKLIAADKCFIVMRYFGNPAFQKHFLANIETDSRRNRWRAMLGAYLEEIGSDQIILARNQAKQQAADTASVNSAAIKSGRPKPALNSDYIPLQRRAFFNNLYNGNPIVYNEISDYKKTLFNAYFQAYSAVCGGKFNEPIKTYTHMGKEYVGKEYSYRTTINKYKYVIVDTVSLPASAYPIYKRIDETLTQNIMQEAVREGVSLGYALFTFQEAASDLKKISVNLLEAEGCNSPTQQQFEHNLRRIFEN